MTLHKILYEAHSGIRWLVLLVLLITLIKLLMTWLGKKEYSKADRGLTSATVGLLDLQFLLGISLIVWYLTQASGLTGYLYEHAGINLVAIIVAHVASKGADLPGPLRARRTVSLLLLSAALIVVAVSRMPNGWSMGGG